MRTDLPVVPWSSRALVAVAFVLAAAPVVLFGTRAALHCDELNVLRHITYFADGDFGHSSRPGLLWLLLVPLAWIDSPWVMVEVARAVAVVASLLTLALVARLGREDGDPAAATRASLAVLILGTSASWQGHAFELRTDTFVTPMTLLLLSILTGPSLRWRRAAGVGVLLGATALVSQKSVYNGVGLALAWPAASLLSGAAREGRWIRGFLGRGVVIGAAAALCIGLWYAAMANLTGQGEDYLGRNVASVTKTAWDGPAGLRTHGESLLSAVRLGPALWVLAPFGAVLAATQRFRAPRVVAASIVGAALLSTVFFHRGFFMYFIASFEPMLALPAAHVLSVLFGRLGSPRALLVAGALVLAVGGVAGYEPARAIAATSVAPHARFLQDVERLFPEPVPYLDLLGTVPGYDEVSFFGTAPNRDAFRRRRGPSPFVQLAREKKPQFFVREYMSRERYFYPAERRWLWQHYLPVRPNLYVHGLRMPVDAESGTRTGELLLSGAYEVVFRGGWSGAALLDGTPVSDGEILDLQAGRHEITAQSTHGAGELWILWGTGRRPLTERDRDQRDFSMFPLLTRERYQQYDGRGKPGDLLTPPEDPTIDSRDRAVRQRQHAAEQDQRAKALGRPQPARARAQPAFDAPEPADSTETPETAAPAVDPREDLSE